VDPSLVRAGIAVAAAYLLGSLPMGVIVAAVTGGVDPRTVGSGRTGGNNALRAMGPGRAAVVFALDVAKGAAAVLVARLLGADPPLEAVAGTVAIFGAWRSVFLRFGGGRGVATGIGGLLLIDPLATLFAAPIALGAIVVSRYVSLGSLLGSAAAGLIVVAFIALGLLQPGYVGFALAGPLVIWAAHADNIDRILHGRERRFTGLRGSPP